MKSVYVLKKVKGVSVEIMGVYSTSKKACDKGHKISKKTDVENDISYSVITYELNK